MAPSLFGTHRLRVSAEITGTAFTPDHRTFVVVYCEPVEKKQSLLFQLLEDFCDRIRTLRTDYTACSTFRLRHHR
jgi:hypothetical protein